MLLLPRFWRVVGAAILRRLLSLFRAVVLFGWRPVNVRLPVTASRDNAVTRFDEPVDWRVVERLPVTVPSLLRSRKRISGRLPLPRSADPRVESALANPSARRLPVVVLRRPVSLPFRETARSLSRLAESRLPPAVLRLLPSVPRDRVTARESSRVLAKPCLSAVFVAARLSGRTGVPRRSRRLRSMRPSSRTRRRSRFDTL